MSSEEHEDQRPEGGRPESGKPKRPQQVYTLVVEVGRKDGDGVRETVAILKQADLAPLDVSGYGTLEEREAAGDEIDGDERALMQRALDENSVVVAQMTPFYGD